MGRSIFNPIHWLSSSFLKYIFWGKKDEMGEGITLWRFNLHPVKIYIANQLSY